MNWLMISLIFVVTMTLPAFWAVQYANRSNSQAALRLAPASQGHARAIGHGVILPIRANVAALTRAEQKLAAKATPKKQLNESALDHQVDDVIHRLILMS